MVLFLRVARKAPRSTPVSVTTHATPVLACSGEGSARSDEGSDSERVFVLRDTLHQRPPVGTARPRTNSTNEHLVRGERLGKMGSIEPGGM